MTGKRTLYRVGILSTLFLSLLTFSEKSAAAKNDKTVITIVSDGLTSSGYMQSLAIGKTLGEIRQRKFTVTPETSSLLRIKMLTTQQADYCACGMDSYFAQEGLLQFETAETGPQPIRVILSSSGEFRYNLAIAKDSQVKDLSDLKGKRIAWIRNSDQLNAITTAFLSYANTSWEDVQKMTFPGYEAAVEGFVKKQIDAILISNNSPQLDVVMQGRRKAFLPPLSNKDRQNLSRVKSIAPYLSPVASFSDPLKWRGFSHPYPVLLTTAQRNEDDVYNLIKAISENLDAIQTHTPSAEGWNLSWQNLTWVMPYHKGAIRYFQEVGIWSDAAQAHQNKLIRRQAALIKAFKDFKATNPEEDSFVSGWRYIREITLAE